jgi:signal transduction histidine kinase
MSHELDRLRSTERTLARLRVLAAALALGVVGGLGVRYPAGYDDWAWAVTGALAAGAALLSVAAERELDPRALRLVGAVALVFDAAIVHAYVLVYTFTNGFPSRSLLYLVAVEAALRYGLRGLVLTFASGGLLALTEWFRESRFDGGGYDAGYALVPFAIELVLVLLVGSLVASFRRETRVAETRAAEAVELRDELGRRADLLDAANRCARALASSLQLEPAFNAFVRELRGLVPFDRAAIALADDGAIRVIAASGVGADDAIPPGTTLPWGPVVEQVIGRGEPVYRPRLDPDEYADEVLLGELGLRSRAVAPLLLGPRAIGLLAVLRVEEDAFDQDEIELVTLLGRLVATAVQNIRNFESEHRTVDELRRLSALRADFVSLVSHELRSPMAAVIGSARTLQARWRELSPEQRDAFLSLIAEETSRLAALVGDVLDTSRIEAGTFSYRFDDVDLADLVRESAAAAGVGQDDVRLLVDVTDPVPRIRGDRERLKQVLTNLLDNAVKYSPAGGGVHVSCAVAEGRVRIDVRDEGPGIAADQQQLIFEKFGRARDGLVKPGTGLGLFIARSIVEAHGGSLVVRSAPGRGSTFTADFPL